MKINFIPKNIEWILNKDLDKQNKRYQFECWEYGFPEKTTFSCFAFSPSKIVGKINKFFKKKK
jgi:hypothetical protein